MERELSDERRIYLEKTLNPDIALRRTAYDDQGKPPCDEDTRVEILADITTWVNDISPGSRNFFWLTGDPGCGKSAITASLARYSKDSGTLWAQFFINRNNEATTNPRVYFPSIAHQIAEHSRNKVIEKTIYDILKAKPSLLDGMTLDQARVLFVQVVQVACDLDKGRPVVIVIDGLDETSRKSLKDTATIFSKLFKELKRPNAKVFISSRTDNEITKPFYRSLQSNKDHVMHLHLDTTDPSCIEDVSRYLSRNLQRLVEEWDLYWEVWPGRERFEKLCHRAAGLFIWAVTAVRFFEEQLDLYGRECLNRRPDALSAEGMNDVNRLYQTILAITYSSGATLVEDGWAHETFRWLIGFIIGLKEPLPIGDVGALLDLRQTPTSDPVDILHLTSKLRTVLVAGTGEITKDTIPRLHKSFVEFITSKGADEQFRINPDVVDVEIGLKCLRLISRLRDDHVRLTTPPAIVRYAIQNWTRHLPIEGKASGIAIFADDDQALPGISGSWTPTALGQSLMTFSGDFRTHMYNPRQDSRHYAIEVGDEVKTIAVSMDGRLIASGSRAGDICLWDGRSHKPIGKPFRGHSNLVYSVCFTPDSRWLVSGGGDKSVRVWNCQTGQEACDPLWGHTNAVQSVCTDGNLIISGSYKTIRIWDLTSRKQVGSPIDADSYAYDVSLSNDGRIAAGVGLTVSVWDVKTRHRIASMEGHSATVLTVAFSPYNSHIASGSSDCSIRLWDTQTYTQIGEFTRHSSIVRSVSFSPDGEWIASGSNDMTVCLWHYITDQRGPLLKGHTGFVTSVAFSSDSCRLITGSPDGTVRVWSKFRWKEWPEMSEQITTIHLRPSQHINENPSIVSACYSLDRTVYATSTFGGHVSLWNPAYDLLWESDTPIYPIHVLRLTASHLIISSPDGYIWVWDVVEGKPTRKTPTFLRSQLNTKDTHRFIMRSSSSTEKSIARWIPFEVDAGLWAYVDGTFIRFESLGGGSVTLIDASRVGALFQPPLKTFAG